MGDEKIPSGSPPRNIPTLVLEAGVPTLLLMLQLESGWAFQILLFDAPTTIAAPLVLCQFNCAPWQSSAALFGMVICVVWLYCPLVPAVGSIFTLTGLFALPPLPAAIAALTHAPISDPEHQVGGLVVLQADALYAPMIIDGVVLGGGLEANADVEKMIEKIRRRIFMV